MKILNIVICCVLALSMASCEDFLDVRPKAEKLERDLFKDAKGFESAIYGVYGTLQKEQLYGKNMTWGITEVLAQNLRCYDESTHKLAKFEYEGDDDLKYMFSGVWNNAYQTIGYANNILNQLENWSPASLPFYNLYKGEMLGVRAMLHFDLLRIFAPMDENKQGIPYVRTYNPEVKPFSTVGEVYKQIIADLTEAENLLKDQEELVAFPRNNGNYYKFLNYQETHFNVYAIRALLARVYWMKSQGKPGADLDKAGKYAESIIKSGKFPLAQMEEVKDYLAGSLSPKETIFGIYSTKHLEICKSYLFELNMGRSYVPYSEGSYYSYKSIYAKDVNPGISEDYREKFHFEQRQGGYVSFKKLTDVIAIEEGIATSKPNLIAGITLMHASEMYLIAAEALLEKNYDVAVSYFNEEIQSRGLAPVNSDVKLNKDMIFHEYHKELFGEGQTWFNMKRLNREFISNISGEKVPGSEKIYKLPIPEEEFEYRN